MSRKSCIFAPSKNNGLWCNGNTTDSGPVILGSNPGSPAKKEAVSQTRKQPLFFMPSAARSAPPRHFQGKVLPLPRKRCGTFRKKRQSFLARALPLFFFAGSRPIHLIRISRRLPALRPEAGTPPPRRRMSGAARRPRRISGSPAACGSAGRASIGDETLCIRWFRV